MKDKNYRLALKALSFKSVLNALIIDTNTNAPPPPPPPKPNIKSPSLRSESDLNNDRNSVDSTFTVSSRTSSLSKSLARVMDYDGDETDSEDRSLNEKCYPKFGSPLSDQPKANDNTTRRPTSIYSVWENDSIGNESSETLNQLTTQDRDYRLASTTSLNDIMLSSASNRSSIILDNGSISDSPDTPWQSMIRVMRDTIMEAERQQAMRKMPWNRNANGTISRDSHTADAAFFVADMDIVRQKYAAWTQWMPNIKPFYGE
jgi:hypothetical protein